MDYTVHGVAKSWTRLSYSHKFSSVLDVHNIFTFKKHIDQFLIKWLGVISQ